MESFTSILFPGAALPHVDDDGVPQCFADLHLDQVVAEVVAGPGFGHRGEGLAAFFRRPLRDPAAVGYRQDVFRDLQRGGVKQAIDDFVVQSDTARENLRQGSLLSHPLQRQGWFVYAAEAYCCAMQALHDALSTAQPESAGLTAFTAHLAGYVAGQRFSDLRTQTREVQERLAQIRYTVYIDGLHVRVGCYADQDDYGERIVETFRRFVTDDGDKYHIPAENFPDMNNVEEQILDGVAALHPDEFALLARYCDEHRDFIEPVVERFDREIRFYLAYLAFMARLTAMSLPFSYPEISVEPGTVHVAGGFDLALAMRSVNDATSHVVGNDFELTGAERIFIVTGPNQGGKTTLARTVGQCLYLAGLGCPVPARHAKLMLTDGVYTHFERREDMVSLHGKLDDELVRIHDILSSATARSVVVMNESFASTTAEDALEIGTEVLRRIIRLGCIAVYVTFLDELTSLDPACVSMVGDMVADDPGRRTFHFTRRPADGRAYAAALAGKYGLTRKMLLNRIVK